jgi:hypothetical protein
MTSEVGDSTTQTQSTLTLALHSRARATLLADADLRNNARLLSLTLPQAHSWLLAVPYKPTLELSPNEFRQAARYRLGVSDHNHQGNLRRRQCDKVQNPRDQGLSYGTTQLNAMVEASLTAATTASTIFLIILSMRPVTVPRWKLCGCLHVSWLPTGALLA